MMPISAKHHKGIVCVNLCLKSLCSVPALSKVEGSSVAINTKALDKAFKGRLYFYPQKTA
jgi:hypothetical protein